MQRRNKVGGIVDRRFGEDDPNMTLEDKMMERFAREQMKSHKKNTVFDLEGSDDDTEQVTLTHAGKTLFDDDDMEVGRDDFDENISDMESDDERSARKKFLKRLRAEEEAAEGEGEDGQPERKKTKKEVMEEVIAKSKAFKYVRIPPEASASSHLLITFFYRNDKPPRRKTKIYESSSTRN